MSKTESTRRTALAGILAVSVSILQPVMAQQQGTATTTKQAGVLKAADTTNLMPAQVFFRGQSATVQTRNSGGVRYADGMFTLMALVDTSGYSSGIQQRYQAYLITEVPLELGDGSDARKLVPGAYGVGFIQNDRFVVMDLGANELLNVGSHHDADLRRPMPLQVLDTPAEGAYRFYEGRSFVTLRRAR
jgi:hypothetical protein